MTERKSVLGTPEERKALGGRTPRKEVSCVECGEKAEADRKGDWRCLSPSCGARGVTLRDETMCTTKGPPIAS